MRVPHHEGAMLGSCGLTRLASSAAWVPLLAPLVRQPYCHVVRSDGRTFRSCDGTRPLTSYLLLGDALVLRDAGMPVGHSVWARLS